MTSRDVTSAHEWWGLACGEGSNITKCLELLPNASDLLCSGLKFFKEGSRKPAGVRVANEVIPRANQLVWPDWYQQDKIAGRALGESHSSRPEHVVAVCCANKRTALSCGIKTFCLCAECTVISLLHLKNVSFAGQAKPRVGVSLLLLIGHLSAVQSLEGNQNKKGLRLLAS